ncbi:MAG: exo-alpha-sialidase [Clostridiaceae bacterium]|nr:exo-alpha-sialidase [Clostridiaceae bacterium]
MRKLCKIGDIVVYKNEKTYNCFPNIVLTPSGKIIVAFRQAKDRQKELGFTTHTDITGKGMLVTSSDGGRSWDVEAKEIYDHILGGMNDTNITLLSDGTILAVFYRWRGLMISDVKDLKEWDNVKWNSDRDILNGKFVWRLDGTYTLRSKDEGVSWDDPVKISFQGNDRIEAINELHSRGKALECPDGAILLPVNGSAPTNWANPIRSLIVKSRDKGLTWEYYSTIAQSDDTDFYETFVYRTVSGKMVAFMRGQKPIWRYLKTARNRESGLYTSESCDGGLTWTPPKKAAFEAPSTPFDVIRLNDKNALLTYGYRKPPYGIRARILDKECENIDGSEEFILRDDGLGRDLGYSSSIQLPDGRIFIVYYFYGEDSIRHIAGTYCTYE